MVFGDDYGIKPIFTNAGSLKRQLSKKVDKELFFSPSAKFAVVHSSTINPCQYSVTFLKGPGFQANTM